MAKKKAKKATKKAAKKTTKKASKKKMFDMIITIVEDFGQSDWSGQVIKEQIWVYWKGILYYSHKTRH